MNITPLCGRVYQAVEGFERYLKIELSSGSKIENFSISDNLSSATESTNHPLFYAENVSAPAFWTQNEWQEPFRFEFDSINEAASTLHSIQRNWTSTLFTQFRRGSLIQSKLPAISSKPKTFPWLYPESPIGAWTLLDAHTIIASARCSSPFPGGLITFEEDKAGPPSRAYLKFQEALVRARKWPLPNERCVDAGASPGGWSWVLARLGTETTAIDRAPLNERIMKMPGLHFIKHDAFTLKPEEIGPIDWLFSDVICYPPRLYDWIEKWLVSGLCKNFVCTIKMQGEADFETTRRFAAIPGSMVLHLYHNKHELTWIKTESVGTEH